MLSLYFKKKLNQNRFACSRCFLKAENDFQKHKPNVSLDLKILVHKFLGWFNVLNFLDIVEIYGHDLIPSMVFMLWQKEGKKKK